MADERLYERLRRITLDDSFITNRRPDALRECHIAMHDLVEDNHFYPHAGQMDADGLWLRSADGPFDLHLEIRDDGKLLFAISADRLAEPLPIILPAKALRSIIKDYFLMCESYDNAIANGNHMQVEAIDMGRRGVHNEGSEMLKSMLENHIYMNFDTARRLFTLVCALHLR